MAKTKDDTAAASDAKSELRAAEDELYGADAPRDAKGGIMEKGLGSKHAELPKEQKVRLAAIAVEAAAEDLVNQAAALTGTLDRLRTARQELAAASK